MLGQASRVGQQPAQARFVAAHVDFAAAQSRGDIRLVEHHQGVAGLDRALRANRLQARRVGRVDPQLVLGTGHADRVDLRMPGHRKQQ
ncbi:hypothetical protein D3C81_1401250 [compost metagenome]